MLVHVDHSQRDLAHASSLRPTAESQVPFLTIRYNVNACIEHLQNPLYLTILPIAGRQGWASSPAVSQCDACHCVPSCPHPASSQRASAAARVQGRRRVPYTSRVSGSQGHERLPSRQRWMLGQITRGWDSQGATAQQLLLAAV